MGTVNTYKHRPLKVEVIQWTGDNVEEVLTFLVGTPHIAAKNYRTVLSITLTTRDGTYLPVRKDDFIVKSSDNEVHAYSPRRFNELYEKL